MDEPAGDPPPPDSGPYWPAPPDPTVASSQLLPPTPSWAPTPAGPHPEQRPVVSPPGHPLFVVYTVVMTLLYLGSAYNGYRLMQDESFFPERYSPEFRRLWGVIVISVGLALALVHLVGLVAPKRPWGWVYKLVLICLGFTSCCLWPVTIPLIRRWLKPDMKRYYRMQ